LPFSSNCVKPPFFDQLLGFCHDGWLRKGLILVVSKENASKNDMQRAIKNPQKMRAFYAST
jgi:hypothetical protein